VPDLEKKYYLKMEMDVAVVVLYVLNGGMDIVTHIHPNELSKKTISIFFIKILICTNHDTILLIISTIC